MLNCQHWCTISISIQFILFEETLLCWENGVKIREKQIDKYNFSLISTEFRQKNLWHWRKQVFDNFFYCIVTLHNFCFLFAIFIAFESRNWKSIKVGTTIPLDSRGRHRKVKRFLFVDQVTYLALIK